METEKPKIYLNPPPQDGKCERCGKHISELEPFEEEGKFKGAKLVKTFRAMIEEKIEEYEVILNEYSYDEYKKDDNIKALEEKYGKEKVDNAFLYDQVSNTIGASWECRDCIRM